MNHEPAHERLCRFTFAALQPGTYTLKIEQKGFQTHEQRSVVLSANEAWRWVS